MNKKEIARMIDISAVRTDATISEIEELAAAAKEYEFVAAFVMPCFTAKLIKMLEVVPQTMVGGVVGFPSGASTTISKVVEARDLIAMGCEEIDMVINVGALKSRDYELVKTDIRAVVDACQGLPVKAILEVAYLDEEEIMRAAELAARENVAYIKTGTGWAAKPTTVETVSLIKKAVGDTSKIKAAGGIRDLDTLLAMVDAGCSRFGIGLKSAITIMQEAEERFA